MSEEQTGIKSYGIGIALGIVGVLIGALVWKYIAIWTGYMFGAIALVSAGLAGGGFGLLTMGGNRAIRAIIGASLGLASIVMGYYFIYTSPVDIGWYGSVIPAELMSFEEFMGAMIEPIDLLFLAIGLYEGAKLGAMEG
ncbi:MAG: hypothetical protein U9N38_06865 [Thermodesulfobacteriota bacterium]|nr:hypothetical protein [Thermodesulfobacteriota bacterium]